MKGDLILPVSDIAGRRGEATYDHAEDQHHVSHRCHHLGQWGPESSY
jgi:hypothetical protein